MAKFEQENYTIEQFMHDLRQPVNVLQMTVANLRSSLAPSIDQVEETCLLAKLDRIERQVQRLSELIEVNSPWISGRL